MTFYEIHYLTIDLRLRRGKPFWIDLKREYKEMGIVPQEEKFLYIPLSQKKGGRRRRWISYQKENLSPFRYSLYKRENIFLFSSP